VSWEEDIKQKAKELSMLSEHLSRPKPVKYKVIALPDWNNKIQPPFTIGDIVYQFRNNDYGGASTDSAIHGHECISVTEDPNGEAYPFRTIPLSRLMRLSHLTPQED